MKTTFHKNLKAFTLCAGFFSLVACKEKSSVKPDLIPEVDGINTIEVTNLAISVKNTYFDSLQTNDYSYPIAAIGGVTNDAFYGRTMAGAYMQFIPPYDNFTFPTGVVFDSSVLSIPYIGFSYADSNRTDNNHLIKVRAHEITENFDLGDGKTKYYAFNKKTYNTTPIATADISVKSLSDTAVALANGDTVSRLLRINVNSLSARFKSMSDANQIASASIFLQNFKGIYLGPDTTATQNTIAYFGMTGINSSTDYSRAQIECYYHTPTAAKQKVIFRFIPSYCSFFNAISRNYVGTPAANYFANQTVPRDSILVQGYPGFRSDITVKVENIPPSVINKATITLTALKTGDDARFNAPSQLILTVLEDDGTERAVSDILNNDGTTNTYGQLFVDGSARKIKINGTDFVQYSLNIPREFQKAISSGKKELKLRLSSSVTYPGAFRMVAGGPNSTNADTRLKLNIIYTKLK